MKREMMKREMMRKVSSEKSVIMRDERSHLYPLDLN
jgi:hypothetical protein